MSRRSICIFEDDRLENLLPLVHLRPVFELRCGITLLREKIERTYPDSRVHLLCREELTDTVREKVKATSVNAPLTMRGEETLFLNGRILARDDLAERIPLRGPEEVGLKEGVLIYARLSPPTLGQILKDAKGSKGIAIDKFRGKAETKEVAIDLISYPWDLVKENAEAIKDDYRTLGGGKVEGFLDERVAIYGDKSQLYIGEGARVEAGVVLNLEGGPIYIGRGARVRPFTLIDGPSFVGEDSLIDGAKLRGGCSIGKGCRLGGEVEETIFQGYSNKHHDGFLGHAYVGEWVNLGALTTNSDLKNNYGEVKVYIKGRPMNSGELKVGCFIGDHAKLAIGTLLPTGAVIGVAANIFGSGFIPKYVPSFSWGGGDKFVEHAPEKAIATAEKVMSRRKVEQSPAEAALLRQVYEMTAGEREKAGVRKG